MNEADVRALVAELLDDEPPRIPPGLGKIVEAAEGHRFTLIL